MNHIKETIVELERHLEKLRIDAAAIERVLVILKDCDNEVVVTAEPIPKSPRTSHKRKSTKKSKYKGVVPIDYADGSKRYRANFWDAKRKKSTHIGNYDNELEAAAAVQCALGNAEEAERLWPQAKIPPKKSVEKYYRCKHCKLETRIKPVQCMSCNSASFDGPLTRGLED